MLLPPRTSGLLLGAAVLALLGSVSACNTVEGAGEDIQSVGKATSGAAESAGAGDDDDDPNAQRQSQ